MVKNDVNITVGTDTSQAAVGFATMVNTFALVANQIIQKSEEMANGIINGLKETVYEYGTVETQLQRINTLFTEGIDVTDELDEVTEMLAMKYGLAGGQVEALGAAYNALSAGMGVTALKMGDASQMLLFTEAALRLSVAGMVEAELATTALSNVWPGLEMGRQVAKART